MPLKLQVPDMYIAPLRELVGLPPESMKALLLGLQEAKPSLKLDDFSEVIAERLDVNQTTARGIVELLSSLYAVREALGGDISEFVDGLRAAIEESHPDIQPSDWSSFHEVITAAFSAESPLSISAKALDVLTDHHRIFLQARVITDLRPVFGPELSEAPSAFVTVHNLKLIYRADGVSRNLHLALDSVDVQTLITTLQRAVEKENSLRALAEEKRLTLLEVKP